MTDQVRAALEALLSQWDAEAGAMPDSRVRTVLQSCAMEVRAILLDPVIARAALAAASPEPERCSCGCLLSQHSAPHDVPDQPICHGCSGDRCGQPAPAAPSVAALREHPGEHHTFSMTCDRCGKRGYVNLSVIGPDERLSIEPIGDHP